jgi:hypothetical protein
MVCPPFVKSAHRRAGDASPKLDLARIIADGVE